MCVFKIYFGDSFCLGLTHSDQSSGLLHPVERPADMTVEVLFTPPDDVIETLHQLILKEQQQMETHV